MFALDAKPVCAACVAQRPAEKKAAGEKLQLGRIVDKTICSVCHADHGETDLPLIGGLPVCDACSPKVLAWPFPFWIKAGMVALLLVLGWALWLGRHHFPAGRHMVLAERAMDHGDYRHASDEFAQVLKLQPNIQKAVLLGAKADLLAGDPDSALHFFRGRTHLKHDALYNEVMALLKRSVDAVSKARRATELDSAGRWDEAARLMTEAAEEYPQSQNLVIAGQVYSARAAFYRKDYEAALRFTDAAWRSAPDDPNLTASMAAALAAKYAVTGDQQFRTQAEQMLARAHELADRSPDDRAAYADYAPRIRYRLDSSQIIDTAEYDRRFRKQGAQHQ
jgi:tetratricopeptide (TPR) repeat protein